MSSTHIFLFIAVHVFVVVAAILLWPLLRKKTSYVTEDIGQPTAQRASLKEAIAGIDAELARGEMDAAAADARRREVLLRARAEASEGAEHMQKAATGTRVGVAALAMLGLAAVSSFLYMWLGNPGAMNPAAQQPVAQKGEVGPAQVAEMVKRLEAKLSAGPPKVEDLTGWKMLARSQMVMQQFGKAAESYRTALRLAPNNTELETNLAEALLGQAEGKPSDEIDTLLASAYGREPTNSKILWLSAAVAQERGDKPKAVKFLKEARATLSPDSEEAKQIDKFIADLSK